MRQYIKECSSGVHGWNSIWMQSVKMTHQKIFTISFSAHPHSILWGHTLLTSSGEAWRYRYLDQFVDIPHSCIWSHIALFICNANVVSSKHRLGFNVGVYSIMKYISTFSFCTYFSLSLFFSGGLNPLSLTGGQHRGTEKRKQRKSFFHCSFLRASFAVVR